MSKKLLPKFLIYQANPKEFHICLEAQGKFFRWCSYYPPTMDVRFSRAITKIEDMPLNKAPRTKRFDEGFYTINKSDTKELIESKIAEGIELKSFSFVLNGKNLNGRFSIKKNGNITVLQKFKDKFAVEEDVLSGDLARTISTMIPDYDEKKVDLNSLQKKVDLNRLQKVKPAKSPPPNVQVVEEPPVEELTAEKKIGGVVYHFTRYTSKNEPDICVITNAKGEIMILKKVKNKWSMQTPLGRALLSKEKEFAAHANLLYNSSDL